MFTKDITIKRLGVKLWELVGDLSYENNELRITAKSGLKTDGASIPKPFWRLIGSPLTGRYVKSAIIHDALSVSYTHLTLPTKRIV